MKARLHREGGRKSDIETPGGAGEPRHTKRGPEELLKKKKGGDVNQHPNVLQTGE